MLSAAPALERKPGVQIRPFTVDLIGEVDAFNTRLANAGIKYRFPNTAISKWLPKIDGRHIFQEYFVAVDGTGAVRGAYILKSQDFFIRGTRRRVGFYHLPLSEGLIDRQFGSIGLRLLTDALKREPAIFVLGIGSLQEPLSRMLTAMSWRLTPVPFYFKVVRPFRVARKIAYLRSSALRRLALDSAAFCGGAWLMAQLSDAWVGRPTREATAKVEPEFDAWADSIWADCRDHYAMIGVRDSETLNILYPSRDQRYIRIVVSLRGVSIGWAVVLATDMRGHKYFGDLRVGSIVDCLARPDHAGDVIGAAVRCLHDRSVDLIVSNQMAGSWVNGLKRNGFFAGPSTFLFGTSKSLESLLTSHDALDGVHLNRGDGDGPINL